MSARLGNWLGLSIVLLKVVDSGSYFMFLVPSQLIIHVYDKYYTQFKIGGCLDA